MEGICVNYSNLLKQLKKQFRRKKLRTTFGMWLLLAGGAAAVAALHPFMQDVSQSGQPVGRSSASREALPAAVSHVLLRQAPAVKAGGVSSRQVYLRKQYVCGEETLPAGTMTSAQIADLAKRHPDWQQRLNPDGSVLFIEQIEDLAPDYKGHAYFGIDKAGKLTLFDGLPMKDKAIRTFFQLNIRELESSLSPDVLQELYSGIQISDYAEYSSVLSTFCDYALDEQNPAAGSSTGGVTHEF